MKKIYPRITSIDALRAFALFGILLVHVRHGFNADVLGTMNTTFDSILGNAILALLHGKCALIFEILFGISFYIILRKPNYPSSKFVWRCILLFLLGCINRFFYDSDALMTYGLYGIVLVAVRNLSNKNVLICAISIHIISLIGTSLNFAAFIMPPVHMSFRYYDGISFLTFVRYGINNTWCCLLGNLMGFNYSILANFAIGYWLGRIGFVDKWDKIIDKKFVCYSLIIYIIFAIPYFSILMHYVNIENEILINVVSLCQNFSGASFYTFLLIFLYNNNNTIHSLLRKTEAYGKCGLTNYSMQGFWGVISFLFLRLAFLNWNFSVIVLGAVVFYIIQLIFCNIWLKYFKNGPMEYIWRCATERKILSIKANN